MKLQFRKDSKLPASTYGLVQVVKRRKYNLGGQINAADSYERIDRASSNEQNLPLFGLPALRSGGSLTHADSGGAAGPNYQLLGRGSDALSEAELHDAFGFDIQIPLATLDDLPNQNIKLEEKNFETSAFELKGAKFGKFLGSVLWGCEVWWENKEPTVKMLPLKKGEEETTSASFKIAAKEWNSVKPVVTGYAPRFQLPNK